MCILLLSISVFSFFQSPKFGFEFRRMCERCVLMYVLMMNDEKKKSKYFIGLSYCIHTRTKKMNHEIPFEIDVQPK